MIKSYIRIVTYLITWNLLEYVWHASRIIILSIDIETNTGPQHSFSNQGLTICHWNFNSLSSHTYKTVSFLSAYISVHKFHIICLSEIYLNSETPSPDDDNLKTPGYNITRNDHSSNTNSGEFAFYYKNTLLFKLINVKYFQAPFYSK